MDEINGQIAKRLRRLRRAAGLSLDALATRAQVSRATLSQIEAVKTNPTIAVLWKIARGLGVPFSALLGAEAPPEVRLDRRAEARYLYSEDHRFRSRPLLANVPGHRVELYELRLEPGAAEDAQAHPPGTVEQIIVVSGALAVTLDARTYQLAPGDALRFPADRPHRYECVGQAPFVGHSLILYER